MSIPKISDFMTKDVKTSLPDINPTMFISPSTTGAPETSFFNNLSIKNLIG